ncbi:mitochondrial matrix iron-sulfur protein [Conglomerata obtusa]
MLQELTKTFDLKQKIPLIFKTLTERFVVNADKGNTLLEVAHKNKIDLEGACEGSLACSTCHVVLDKKLYQKLNEPSDREYDMLDLAYGQTPTSRLGCQIKVDERLRNAIFRIPTATRNMAVDGFKPKPH